jgi:hypothetical protein
MEYFAGLDVSLDTISICIVNADGDILLEKKIEAEPAAIVAVLKHFGRPFKRIGLEAGPTSSWLYSELRGAGHAAICFDDNSRCRAQSWLLLIEPASTSPNVSQDREMWGRTSA